MKRDFSQTQIEELWRIADQNQAELYNMVAEKVEEREMLEAAAELWVAEQYLSAVKEREAMTVKKLEQIVVNLKEADQTYGDYLQTLNQQLDAYDQRLRSVAELLQPEKLSMNNDQYQRELQAISERYSETKGNSEIVKLELWLTPGYQLDEKELKEAREMVEAYFALGTDEGRVYYEDMYSPVDESVYADWTEIHWKKFQLMGALDQKIGTWNSFGNGVVEAVPFWGDLSDLTMKNQAGLRGYKFEELCLSDNVFTNSHIQHPYVTFGGNLTGGLLTYELAAGAAGNIPGLAQRINSISGRLSAYPILNRIGQDHISNIIGATVIDTGVLTLPGAIGDIARGESPGNVFKNAGLDMGRNLLFNIGGEAISGALGAVLKRGESGKTSGKVWDYSKQFDGELANFNAGYEIKNVIEEDLYLVQFHSNAEVGSGRSLKYWTTFDEANGISTVYDYMNQMALLSNWGARDNVSIAKIPAGTKIKYAIGTAKEQVGAIESRPGGGLQILFEQFDDGWVLDTRPLP